jgi:hypothetical protein
MNYNVLLIYSFYYDDEFIRKKIEKYIHFFSEIYIVKNFNNEFECYFSLDNNFTTYIICNDTIIRNDKIHLISKLLSYREKLYSIDVPLLVGKYYNLKYQLTKFCDFTNSFIRSDIFLLNNQAYGLIKNNIFKHNSNQIKISENLSKINLALFSSEINKFDSLNKSSYVERKKFSIFYERKMTQIIYQNGIVVPINYNNIRNYYEKLSRIFSFY